MVSYDHALNEGFDVLGRIPEFFLLEKNQLELLQGELSRIEWIVSES